MKPETILQSDVLDIIFEDRNKEYGAYKLRKNYNLRILQALGGTFALAGLFVILQSMRVSNDESLNYVIPPYAELASVEMEKDKPVEKKPEEEKPRQQQKPVPTIAHVTPVITDDPVERPMPTINDLDNSAISTITNNVPSGNGGDTFNPPGDPGGSAQTFTPATDPGPADGGPLEYADVMPSFNGDIVRYMLRYLRQPDDLESGERIVVRVRFVVNEEGNISDIVVVQSGRRDLDEEVVRVVKKMPRWNPGKQGGRAVPVFFNMPVTFVNNAE